MSKIKADDVKKVAHLARLELPDNLIDTYTEQLEKILGYVAQLEKVDTQGVYPTTRAVEVINVLREDSLEDSTIRENLLDLAPERKDDFFKVPKILSE